MNLYGLQLDSIKLAFCINVVCFFVLNEVHAQNVEAREGVTSPITSKIDALFDRWNQTGSPGCAVGVIRDGQIVFNKGYGIANLDWELPITPSTVFYVGSISKQFTAAAIAILALEKRIDLDADIRTYLPEVKVHEPPITVRHLVHHTSGVPGLYRAMHDAGLDVANKITDDEALNLLAGLDLDFVPGERYRYSNGGYQLLALIVERASGVSLREFTQERIFKPLKMADTHFHDNAKHIIPRRAMSYQRSKDGWFVQSYLGNFDRVGQGGLYTTLADLARWDGIFYNDKLGIPGLLKLQSTVGVLNSGDMLDYAFGLRYGNHKGEPTVGHGGAMMGFKAGYVRFPERRLTVLALCNLGDIQPMRLAKRVADLYIGE